MTAYSLHIGVDILDPIKWGGWDGRLYGCVNDANAMKALAQRMGYKVFGVLLNNQATFLNVSNAIAQLKAIVRPGDVVWITYSGHGGLIPDLDGDERYKFDSTWCLHDREVTDDEINAAFAGFPVGVIIYLISDSCHSGTVARFMDMAVFREGAVRVRQAPFSALAYNGRLHGRDITVPRAARMVQPAFGPKLVLVAGCKDQEVSYDGFQGRDQGAFTGAMLLNIEKRGLNQSFYKMRERAAKTLQGTGQHPQLMAINADELLNAHIFAIPGKEEKAAQP